MKKLGQYFTTNEILQEKVFEFIKNDPETILEPSFGRGDLIKYVQKKSPKVSFIGYEIDTNLEMLDIKNTLITFGDFLKEDITIHYKTIIGNPPFVRTKTGNLYIDFVKKCYRLLEQDGELIFIVPSDFFKLTSSSQLLNIMMMNGSFTHVFHPNNEKMFDGANIDVLVFRYVKNGEIPKTVIFNNEVKCIKNTYGLITFHEKSEAAQKTFSDYFNIFVGLVSGKEEVFKNDKIGNFYVLNGHNVLEKYVCIDAFPSNSEEIDSYLMEHKEVLIDRKIRKFNDDNWFEWGALRNINSINKNMGKKCIYVKNLTRDNSVSFAGVVNYFGGGLIMMIPKNEMDLDNVVNFINSTKFKENFTFSGRFKIGHRQLSNSELPICYAI